MSTRIWHIAPEQRYRGHYNIKSGRSKVGYATEAEARAFLRNRRELKIKQSYPCAMCDQWHNGAIPKSEKKEVNRGKQNGRSRHSF